MKIVVPVLLLAALAACASSPTPYGPAASARDKGFSEQIIETGRYRVAYAGDDAEQARSFALLRAAELTLEQGQDWFQITRAYTEGDQAHGDRGGRPSVSIGGSAGSGGYSSVGVGVGIGFPLGGRGPSASRDATHVLEVILGKGKKPDSPDAYDARSVQASLLGAPL